MSHMTFNLEVLKSDVSTFSGEESFLEDVAADKFNLTVNTISESADYVIFNVSGDSHQIGLFGRYTKRNR